MLADLRYALRALRKSPGFTLVAALTLALGIGANSAIFSVVNAVLLRPLPYRAPEQLVTVSHYYPSLNGLEAPVSGPGFVDYRDRTRAFDAVAVETAWRPNLTGRGDPERLTGARVSGRFFAAVGVPAALGRTLRPDEDDPGRERVVVLSDGFWRRRFGGDRAALGQTLTLNGEPYEVVGVMPAGFRDFFVPQAEFWRPLALTAEQLTAGRTNEWLSLTARLKPGSTIEQARAEMRTLAGQLKQQYPDAYPPDWSLTVTSLHERGTGQVRPALLVLFGAVGFVLLIACANVANLLLARAAGRSREVAVRAALGAPRRRIVRQLLTESVVLALGGGLLGLAVAQFGVRALGALNPASLPGDAISLDAPVLVFALVLSVATGLLFGVAPALQVSRAALQETLREGGRGAAGDRGAQTVRRGLIVAEVALALMLLAGAGLLVKSFARLQGVSPGFDGRNVLTATIALPDAKYPRDTQQVAFFDQLLPRLAAIPGVEAVGTASSLPLTGASWTGTFTVEGYDPPANQPGPWGDIRLIGGDFAGALGVPLRRGRLFTERDGPGAPRVAVVDEQMVRRFWPNENPIGKRLAFGAAEGEETEWMEVVGVVGHVRQQGLDDDAHVQLYLPYRQQGGGGMAVMVRTSGDPLRAVPLVRAAVQAVDRDQPISQVRTMDEILTNSVGRRRLTTVLLAVFAGFALMLACVGLYGVTAYAVTQRTREIGVRMALGAAGPQVVGAFVRDGLRLVAVGLAVGLVGALGAGRLIASQLYDVRPGDPATLAVTAATLAVVAVLASYLPARRATRVDPMTALRSE
jgi:putative ABC transport system permease protein